MASAASSVSTADIETRLRARNVVLLEHHNRPDARSAAIDLMNRGVVTMLCLELPDIPLEHYSVSTALRNLTHEQLAAHAKARTQRMLNVAVTAEGMAARNAGMEHNLRTILAGHNTGVLIILGADHRVVRHRNHDHDYGCHWWCGRGRGRRHPAAPPATTAPSTTTAAASATPRRPERTTAEKNRQP